MSRSWAELAERYVEARRLEFLALVRAMPEARRPQYLDASGEREASPGVLSHCMSARPFGSGASPSELEALRRSSREDRVQLEVLLGDVIRMHFVKALLHDSGVRPPEFVPALARAAVYTVDPSYNRQFIDLCSREGRKAVHEELLRYLRKGSAWEAAGAMNALYHVQTDGDDRRQEGRLLRICLTRFLRDQDLHARRSLARGIPWRRRCCPPLLRPLRRRALRIVTALDDPYLTKRVAVVLGRARTFPALPPRPFDPPGEVPES